MAKRKSKSKKLEVSIFPSDPKYYVYYDNIGNLISVSNEFNEIFENFLEITYSEYENLVSGKEPFSNYRVGYGTGTEISLYSIFQPAFSFKNELLEWVCNSPTGDTNVVVEWNSKIKYWVFNISDECRTFLQSYTHALVFFVTLENDFDFLIRTIKIKPEDLLASTIFTPFESTFELNIDKITLTTTKVLKSYGLVITHE